MKHISRGVEAGARVESSRSGSATERGQNTSTRGHEVCAIDRRAHRIIIHLCSHFVQSLLAVASSSWSSAARAFLSADSKTLGDMDMSSLRPQHEGADSAES